MKGDKGDTGAQGIAGRNGRDGADGHNGKDGVTTTVTQRQLDTATRAKVAKNSGCYCRHAGSASHRAVITGNEY